MRTHPANLTFALLLLLARVCCAQTTNSSSTANATLDFGRTGLSIPPALEEDVTSPRTIELIAEALRAEQLPSRRAQLVGDLGSCGQAAVVPYLALYAGDADCQVRAEVVRALARLNRHDEQIESLIKRLVADEEPAVRREAVIAAQTAKLPEVISTGLSDADAGVLRAALAAAMTPAHAQLILERYDSLPPALRPRAIEAIGRAGGIAQAAALGSRLNGSPMERAASVRALAHLQSKSSTTRITGMLHEDPHPLVRRECMLALVKIADVAATQSAAISMLKDSDLSVRSAAADALASAPTADAIKPLVSQLSLGNSELHDTSRRALAAAGEASIQAALSLLENPDPKRAADGAWILGQLKSDAGLDRRIALLAISDSDAVVTVVESLGLSKNAKAAPAVFEVLKRHARGEGAAKQITAEAIIACGRLGYRPALDEIRPFLANEDINRRLERSASAWAFGVLGDRTDAGTCQNLMALLNSIFEVESVKFECIKALGNLRYEQASTAISEWASGADLGQSASLKWISHWALGRIKGAPGQYTPPVVRHSADVSVQEMSR